MRNFSLSSNLQKFSSASLNMISFYFSISRRAGRREAVGAEAARERGKCIKIRGKEISEPGTFTYTSREKKRSGNAISCLLTPIAASLPKAAISAQKVGTVKRPILSPDGFPIAPWLITMFGNDRRRTGTYNVFTPSVRQRQISSQRAVRPRRNP